MKRKQLLKGLGAFLGMLILILDGKTALEGAQIGIDLCIKTVIPSLFPFFLLSILLTSSLSGMSMTFLKPIRSLCRLGTGTESLLISGFLGGYPVGAQSVAMAYASGQLSKKNAERMLSFCNNAGPAFLFGMVASMFPNRWTSWSLWGIQIASSLLVAKLIPGEPENISIETKNAMAVTQALRTAIQVMAMVCGWVILFRVILSFLNRWILWMVSAEVQVLLTGLLELSNGCCDLPRIVNLPQRYVICSGILSLGGACVTMQTASVTGDLSLRYYFLGKFLQAAFSLLLAGCVVSGLWPYMLGIIGLVLLFPRRKQKKSSNQQLLGV